MGGRGSGSGLFSVAGEDRAQLNDLISDAKRKRAASYEYTDRNGNVIRGDTGVTRNITASVARASYDSEKAQLSKMKKSDLVQERDKLQSIVNESYQIATRAAASRTGSQFARMSAAETRLRKVNSVLRRFK